MLRHLDVQNYERAELVTGKRQAKHVPQDMCDVT